MPTLNGRPLSEMILVHERGGIYEIDPNVVAEAFTMPESSYTEMTFEHVEDLVGWGVWDAVARLHTETDYCDENPEEWECTPVLVFVRYLS